ncbi:hypothetical protein AOLI_G00241190 [Acnodon oligacanthus]
MFPAYSSASFSHPVPGLQLQPLPAQPQPLLTDSLFSLYTAPPVVLPRDARLFNPPLISSALRIRILQGGDISLPSLLHPSAASGAPRNIDAGNISLTLKSARTSKVLTVPEFTFAFSICRDVICAAFPSRLPIFPSSWTSLFDLESQVSMIIICSWPVCRPVFSSGTFLHIGATCIFSSTVMFSLVGLPSPVNSMVAPHMNLLHIYSDSGSLKTPSNKTHSSQRLAPWSPVAGSTNSYA